MQASKESNFDSDLVEEVSSDSKDLESPSASDSSLAIIDTVDFDKGAWFIVQCYAGYEYKVRSRIEALIEDDSYNGKIYRVLVPEEETVEIKNNKRIEKIVKMFPGYVFIQIEPEEDVLYAIKVLPGVSKFIGAKNQPTPVVEDEILKVLYKVGDKTRKVDVDFEEGEVVKIIAGPFRGYSGSISELNGEKGTLKAMILIFGRETPVELVFDQVERVV